MRSKDATDLGDVPLRRKMFVLSHAIVKKILLVHNSQVVDQSYQRSKSFGCMLKEDILPKNTHDEKYCNIFFSLQS